MRAIETPRACLLVFHTAGEDDGTGSSTRRFVPRPSAIGLARCHVWCFAWRAKARCGGHAEHDGFFPRRRPCPPVCNRGDDAADHAVLGAAEWHRAVVRSGLSRDSWLRSVRLPTECRARHRSNGARCRVWLDRSDSALFAAPKNRSHRTTVNNRTRPVDPAITRKPIQQPEVNQVPNSGLLPIA
jgi:hypothetical protein